MLLSSLDSTCVRSKLVSASSGHPEFISVVTAALSCSSSSSSVTKMNQSVFLPVLKSLAVLLERLGSRFWQFTDSRDPETVLDTIMLNRVFLEKIEEMSLSVCVKDERESESGKNSHEDNMTNSQLVYQRKNDDDDVLDAGGNAESVIFCWVVPFLQSLLDFGPFVDAVVQRMFTAISSKLPNSCGVVHCPESTVLYREVLTAITGMVTLLYSKEAYTSLLNVSDSWLTPLTKCLFTVQQLSARPCHVETAVSIFRKILATDAASQFSQSAKFLSCLQDYKRSFFHSGRQSTFQNSTSSVVKKEFSSSSLSDHLILILKTLTMQNDRGLFNKTEKMSVAMCTPSTSRSIDPDSPPKAYPDSPPRAYPDSPPRAYPDSPPRAFPDSPPRAYPDPPLKAQVKHEQTISERTVTSIERFPVIDNDFNYMTDEDVLANTSDLNNFKPVAIKKEPKTTLFIGKLSAKERASGDPQSSDSTDEMEEWERGPRKKPIVQKTLRRTLSLKLKKSLTPHSVIAKDTSSTITKEVTTPISSTYKTSNVSKVSTSEVANLNFIDSKPLSTKAKLTSIQSLTANTSQTMTKEVTIPTAATCTTSKISTASVPTLNFIGSEQIDTKPSPLGIKPSPLSSRTIVVTERSSPSSTSSSDDSDLPSLDTLMTTPTKSSTVRRRLKIKTDSCGAVSKSLAELDERRISLKKTYVVTSSVGSAPVHHEQRDDTSSLSEVDDIDVDITDFNQFRNSGQSEGKDVSRFVSLEKHSDSSRALSSSEGMKEEADSSFYHQGKKVTEIDHSDTLLPSFHITKPDSQSDPDFVYYNLRDIIETPSPVNMATESDAMSDCSKGHTVCEDKTFNSGVGTDQDNQTLVPPVQRKSLSKLSPVPSENSVCSSRDSKSLTGSPVTVDLVRLNNESINKINMQLNLEKKAQKNVCSKFESFSSTSPPDFPFQDSDFLFQESSSSEELYIPLLPQKRRRISLATSDSESEQSPVCPDQDISTHSSTLPSKRRKQETETEKATSTVRPTKQDSSMCTDHELGPIACQHKPVHVLQADIGLKKSDKSLLPPKRKVSHVTTATRLYEPPGMVYSGRKSILQRPTGSGGSSAVLPRKHNFEQPLGTAKSLPNPLVAGNVTSSLSASKDNTSVRSESIKVPESRNKVTSTFSAHTSELNLMGTRSKPARPVSMTTKPREQLPGSPSRPPQLVSTHLLSNKHLLKPKPAVTVSASHARNKLSLDTASLLDIATSSPIIGSPIRQKFIHQQPKPDFTPKLNIDTRPRKPRTMDDFHSYVLSWDPSVFRYPEQDEDGRRVVPTCRELLGELEHVPLTFTSYDKYFDAFKPLFFLELWQSVSLFVSKM